MSAPVPVVEAELLPATAAALPSGVSREQRDRLAERWLAVKAARSEHTADRYRRDVSTFFRWVDEQGLDVFALLPLNVDEYAAALAAGWAGKLSESTQAGRINAVSAFFRYVQANTPGGYIRNPAEHVDRPHVERRSKTRGVESDELARMCAAARDAGERDYALVMLLVGTGLRISEALGADVEHLRREGRGWYVYVQRKGYRDRRPVQVPETAARAVLRYVGDRTGPLFLGREGERLSRRVAYRRVQAAATAAGITGRKVGPHCMRHTATTLALDEAVPIRDVGAQMGHRSTNTTLLYDDARRELDNPTVAALDRILSGQA